eukprot:s8151_g1.t1
MALFERYKEYLLGDYCYGLRSSEDSGSLIPPWTLVLQYEHAIRKHAYKDLPEAVCAILEPMNQETKRALAWLRRPDLRLDLVSQLRLYGLAQQATHGNATASTAATEGLRNTAGRACRACRVQTLKSQSWHACHGLHQAEAAKQLVQELAARDPCFGGAGDFDLWHLVRGLLKAKLPKASAASSRMPLPLLAATLAAVWMASRRRHQSFKWCRLMAGILAMLASAAGGAAMFLHGVPIGPVQRFVSFCLYNSSLAVGAMPPLYPSPGPFPTHRSLAAVSQEAEIRGENYLNVHAIGQRNTKYLQWTRSVAPLTNRLACHHTQQFQPLALGDNKINSDLAASFKAGWQKSKGGSQAVMDSRTVYEDTFVGCDTEALADARQPNRKPPQKLTSTVCPPGELLETKSHEQRHFQAPRLDLLKAERVPPPRHGCPPAWGVSVSDLSLLRAVSRLAAALRPLLARAPEPKPAAKGIFKVPPSKSAEEMGGAPRDPPKRTAAAQSAYVREHILLRSVSSPEVFATRAERPQAQLVNLDVLELRRNPYMSPGQPASMQLCRYLGLTWPSQPARRHSGREIGCSETKGIPGVPAGFATVSLQLD